jgi:nucleoside-diphosphate-sugar epimerase
MPTVLVTGASGYLGSRLVEMAVERGYYVRVLGNAPPNVPNVQAFPWRLECEPPAEAFGGVAAVFHLGHSFASDSKRGQLSENTNFAGSERLARAALAAGVPRFVFASTVSARPRALNTYGRVKFAIEERLRCLPDASRNIVCARIGLVYGGAEKGLYGLLSKLVRLTPLLPMIGLERKVQPIHIEEVCTGLLALGADALPASHRGPFALAGPVPMFFADWLRLLRRAHTRKGMLLVPVPLRLALLGCDLTNLLPLVPKIDRERVLGLAATEPVASAADLAALGLKIVDPAQRLASLRSERRRIIREASALLSYVAGHRIGSAAAIVRLARGIERLGTGSLGLPGFVLRHAPLLCLLDPLRPSRTHRLAQRIFLASLVLESMDTRLDRPRPTLRRLVQMAIVECMIVPLRLVLGRCYA